MMGYDTRGLLGGPRFWAIVPPGGPTCCREAGDTREGKDTATRLFWGKDSEASGGFRVTVGFSVGGGQRDGGAP